MSVFGGDTIHPMDDKGRISLPAKHRRILPDDQVIIIPSPDEQFPSLWIYSTEAYEQWAASVIASKGGSQENSASAYHIKRTLYRRQETVNIDGAGRILIPVGLRQHASLDKTVRIIGAGEHLELWNDDILAASDEYYSSQQQGKILDLP